MLAVGRAGRQHPALRARRRRARIWREDATLLVEVAAAGHTADPLAGRDCPPPTELGGRGLYVVNQLCDLVQLRSSPAGSVIRIHMHLG